MSASHNPAPYGDAWAAWPYAGNPPGPWRRGNPDYDAAFADALEEGRLAFDAEGYRDTGFNPWEPAHRDEFARAYAQIATSLPPRAVIAPRSCTATPVGRRAA